MKLGFFDGLNTKGLALSLGGGVGGEINRVAPIITPTLGANKITNGEFTTDTTGWTANNAILARVDSATDPGAVSGGADNFCLKITDNGVGAGARSGDLGNVQHSWMSIGGRVYSPSANGLVNAGFITAGSAAGGTDYYTRQVTQEDVWREFVGTFLVTAAGLHTTLAVAGNTGDLSYYDALFIKPVANSGVSLGTVNHQAGTYTCKPTVVDYTQCGIDILWLNANNFVRVVVDRNGTDRALVYICVNGSFAAVANAVGNITYTAEKVLGVIIQTNGTISLYYDGAQLGTDGSITLANFGMGVYGFNPFATNMVGTVTTSRSVTP